MSDEDLVRLVQGELSNRRVCIVRQWLLLDVMLPATDRDQLEEEGRQPTVLYGHHVVFDSQGSITLGEGLITGYESESYGFLFEADGALIVLAGPGGRRFVSHPAAIALGDSACRNAVGLAAHNL